LNLIQSEIYLLPLSGTPPSTRYHNTIGSGYYTPTTRAIGEDLCIRARLRALGRLDWIPQLHVSFSLMPLQLRLDHPDWVIADVKSMSMVLNNTFSWRTDGWGKGFKKLADRLVAPRNDAMNITFCNIPAQLPYYDISDNETICHPSLRWYWTDCLPPALVYAPPYHLTY